MIKKNQKKVFLIILVFSIVFFYKFFFRGLIPIPADIITGVYQPWLSYDWGRSAGVPVQNPLQSDIVSIIYQWRTQSIEAIKNLTFPNWNPRYFIGTPLFSNFQNSLVNLTNIFLFLPINQNIAWGLMIWAQIPLCLYFTYLFLNQYKFNKTASISGALVYTFSLFSVVWLEYGIHVYTLSFLPLLLFFLKKYQTNQNKKYLIYFAISLALQIYGGYPQFSIYSLIISSLFFMLFTKINFKNITYFAISIILGLGLAAPILLPGYKQVSQSIRHIDVTSLSSSNGFLPIQKVITSLSPNFWGNPSTYDYQFKSYYDNDAFFPGTIAIFSLVYLLIISFKNKHKNHIFFLLTIILPFLLSIENFFSIFIRNNFSIIIPKTGIASKILVLSMLGFAYATALSIQHIQTNKNNKIINISFILITFYTFFLLFLSQKQILFTTVSNKNTIYAIFFISLTYIGLLVGRFESTYYIIPIVIFLELFYYSNKYLSFSSSKYMFPKTDEISFLQKNSQHYRISTWDTIPQNMWAPYKLMSPDGYDTLVPLQNYRFLNLIDGNLQNSQASRAKFYKNIDSPLYKLLSVKYFLVNDKQKFSNHKWPNRFEIVFTNKQLSIIKDNQAMPRINLMSNIDISSPDNIDKKMFEEQNPNKLYLESDYGIDIDSIKNCQDDQQQVSFIKDKHNLVSINSQSACPRFLLLSDAYNSNWQVKVDGKQSKVIKADIALRSVYLPPGQHVVDFYYRDKYLYYGVVIFCISTFLAFKFVKK